MSPLFYLFIFALFFFLRRKGRVGESTVREERGSFKIEIKKRFLIYFLHIPFQIYSSCMSVDGFVDQSYQLGSRIYATAGM
jgi:hypothetical protein